MPANLLFRCLARMLYRSLPAGLLGSLLLCLPVPSVQAAADTPATSDTRQGIVGQDRAVWTALEKTYWILDGNPKAPRILYVFSDPNCAYCNALWRQARPWVAAGRVQIRHIMLGMIHPSSFAKAVNLLGSDDPAAALHRHETAVAEFAQQHGGKVRPARDKVGVEPATSLPQAVVSKVEANMRLAQQLGVRGTPAIVWQNPDGSISTVQGVPRQAQEEVFGPLPGG